jgi:hypothetical protein
MTQWCGPSEIELIESYNQKPQCIAGRRAERRLSQPGNIVGSTGSDWRMDHKLASASLSEAGCELRTGKQ